jgi:hypothetical protein
LIKFIAALVVIALIIQLLTAGRLRAEEEVGSSENEEELLGMLLGSLSDSRDKAVIAMSLPGVGSAPRF